MLCRQGARCADRPDTGNALSNLDLLQTRSRGRPRACGARRDIVKRSRNPDRWASLRLTL